MKEALVTLATTVAGLLAIVFGVLSIRGSWRRWEPWHRNPNLPFYLRNGAFAMIPFGVTLLGLSGAILTGNRHHTVATVCVLAVFAGFVVGIWFMARPPGFLKPDWLRREEQ